MLIFSDVVRSSFCATIACNFNENLLETEQNTNLDEVLLFNTTLLFALGQCIRRVALTHLHCRPRARFDAGEFRLTQATLFVRFHFVVVFYFDGACYE